ncbi:hypothetical protein ACEPAG_125 [Sanghuangporus baumii]
MEAPALVLVPSSPLDINPSAKTYPVLSSKNSSPVSSDDSYTTSTSTSTRPDTPPSSYGITIENESGRNSSESTIFSIYSMYSERRQTWHKSTLHNSTVLAGSGLGTIMSNNIGLGLDGNGKEYRRDGSRESGKDLYTTTSITDEARTDSFYRGGANTAGTRSVSHKSSSGSGFFAGSVSAESSSRHQSNTYSYNGAYSNRASSPPQSRPASRRVGSFLDTTAGDFDSSARPESTELAYVIEDSLLRSDANNGAPVRSRSTDVEADTHLSTPQRLHSANSAPTGVDLSASAEWGKYVDLTITDEGHSQPDLSIMRRHSPASGKVHDSPRLSSTTDNADGSWEKNKPFRPPRGSPPIPSQSHSATQQTQIQNQAHAKSDSASTATHYGLVLSPSSSAYGHGLDSMSSTHESGSYVTAPQSVESSNRSITSSLRFKVTNPDPPSSPPPPPFANHASSSSHHGSISSSSSQKGLPALPSSPRPSGIAPITPTRTPIPSEKSNVPVHANRQSSVSSITPPGRTTGTSTSGGSSSSRRSRVHELAEAGIPGAAKPGAEGSPSENGVVAEAVATNEEPEAFFVRNTYAQLDVTGVKGDGYEEGVERTRAKLGHDRRSVQLALRNDARGDITGELSDEELRLLGSVDRYGFFNTPSHDRIVILPASALSKPLHPISQTSTSGPASPPVLSSEPKPRPVSKDLETKRIPKWGRMLEAEGRDQGGNVAIWRIKPSKEKKLRKRVFKGIPDAWRAAAWEVLVARWVGRRKKESLDARRLESMLDDLRREYRSSLDRPSSYDVQIDLDVPRTISGHVLFKTRYGQGQRSLFHTLHSFSLVCNECGYCQGMGPIAATLLCYYEPEKVYSFLVHFHDEYELHDIFLPGFPGLLEAIYVQERIMERMLPSIFAALKKHMISTTSYATKWYITLFANTVPFQTQLRFWDAFLLEGRDVFVIVAVAIVWVLRDHLTSAQASFETVLSLLSSFFVPEDEDALLQWVERALGDKKLRAEMNRWRAEWRGLVREKKDGGVLL